MYHRAGVLLCELVSLLWWLDALLLNLRAAVGEHRDGRYLGAEVERLWVHMDPDFD